MHIANVSLTLISAALFLALSFNPLTAAENKMATLGTGRSIEVMSIKRGLTKDFQDSLVISYKTKLPLSNLIALRKEADEIWDRYMIFAEKQAYHDAAIRAYGPEDPTQKSTPTYTFIYKKDNDSWRTIEPELLTNPKLTEQKVMEFLDRVDFLHRFNEMNAFLLYFSRDWEGSLETPEGPVSFDRMEYAETLHKGLYEIGHFEQKRYVQNIQLTLDNDGATIESEVVSSGMVKGQKQVLRTKTTDVLALRDGSLRLTHKMSTPLSKAPTSSPSPTDTVTSGTPTEASASVATPSHDQPPTGSKK